MFKRKFLGDSNSKFVAVLESDPTYSTELSINDGSAVVYFNVYHADTKGNSLKKEFALVDDVIKALNEFKVQALKGEAEAKKKGLKDKFHWKLPKVVKRKKASE
jgi:hypothetical protein